MRYVPDRFTSDFGPDLPVRVEVTNYDLAARIAERVVLGHHFAFLKGNAARESRRLERLLGSDGGWRVVPLLDEPIELSGVTLHPQPRGVEPLACLVCDRDLYRAEDDVVHLFAAFAEPPQASVRLVVEHNGAALTERELELVDGLAIETLAALLPGSYEAQLELDGRRLGRPVVFTVAEYTLAPLSARLAAHHVEGKRKKHLVFALEVESYQVPFSGKLVVTLVDGVRERGKQRLAAQSPGRYCGRLPLAGAGPFRLRLQSCDDAERVAEVALPGSRREERERTRINELGREAFFALLGEAEALAVRGGFLTHGRTLPTPLVAEEVMTERGALKATKAVAGLCLVVVELASGERRAVEVGDVEAGATVDVDAHGPAVLVVAGGFIDGRAFEGYTTFLRPERLELRLEVPATARPREELVVRLACEGRKSVLLAVRDERLTASERPEVSLAGSLKQAVEAATAGMNDVGIVRLTKFVEPDIYRSLAFGGGLRGLEARSARVAHLAEGAAPPELVATTLDEGEGEPDATADETPREDFPEMLFYGLVPVDGSAEVTVPLADSLGTFTVEAFALADGDWTAVRRSVVVDQPVRLDLELPPTVHPADEGVCGRLRAATASGRVRVVLERDGTPLELLRDGTPVASGAELEAPVTLGFDAAPGTYRARIEDLASGETDAVELTVEEPGRFRSYVRQLLLLEEGEKVDLDGAGALTLRVLPALDEPLDALVKTTADYAHLCCEQTAAKILASTFWYLTIEELVERQQAARIILAGVERERKMLRPRRGFAMYPDSQQVSDYYSRLAVRYLWSLDRFDELPELEPALCRAVREGLELADAAAEAHGMTRVPRQVASIEDAYAAAAAGAAAGVVSFLEQAVELRGAEARLRQPLHRVAERSLMAYAGAAFLALGDRRQGVVLANQVLAELNDRGALYSTVDSAAALVLMIQLRLAGLLEGSSRLRVNGREMDDEEAVALADQVETIEVLSGATAVEVCRVREDDWTALPADVPVTVKLDGGKGREPRHLEPGGRYELEVTLPQGYEVGDLLHVALPPALARIQAGGMLRRFTVDFEGRDRVRVPVYVTAEVTGTQHYGVWVRNMFKEERVGGPGILRLSGASA